MAIAPRLTAEERHQLELVGKRTGSPESVVALAKLAADDAAVPIAAREYITRGWNVFPLDPNTKTAIGTWGKESRLPIEAADVQFANRRNVAVLLGGTSGGLVDIDCDWPEFARLASDDAILDTLPGFGRKSAPGSHRIFVCPDSKNEKADLCRVFRFRLGASAASHARLAGRAHTVTIAEMRANDQYTMFPPSIHPSGESVVWSKPLEPIIPVMTWADAKWHCALNAFVGTCVVLYPDRGVRNEYCMSLTGALLYLMSPRYSDDSELIKDVDSIVFKIGESAGGGNSHKMKHAVNTWAKMKAHAKVTHLPTCLKLMGLADDTRTEIHKWFDREELDERPLITFDGLKIRQVIDDAETALLDSNPGIYESGGQIVHPVLLDKDEFLSDGKVKRRAGSLVVQEVPDYRLLEFMTDVANWHCVFTVKGGKRIVKQGEPPLKLAHHYKARVGARHLPVLCAVVQHPTILDDDTGTILATHGFHRESGIFVDLGDQSFPPVPERPTLEQARESMGRLIEIIEEFPFVLDDDSVGRKCSSRSVMIAAILTGIARPSLPTAPGFVYNAGTAGTGKTLLSHIAARICTGHDATLTSYTPNDDAEMQKRLLATLRDKDAFITYDNVNAEDGDFGGSTICAVLTSPSWTCRVLGHSENLKVSTRAVFQVTGNNISLAGDISRRVLKCDLDAQMDDPRQRKFKLNLDVVIPERRPQLVVDALTCLRWFLQAGRPGLAALGEPLPSFEAWSNWVRGTICALGEPDPVFTQESVATADPERTRLASLLMALRKRFGVGQEKAFKASDVVALYQEDMSLQRSDSGVPIIGGHKAERDLIESVENIVDDRVTAKALTTYMKGHQRRTIDGVQLRAGSKNHSAVFWLVQVQASITERDTLLADAELDLADDAEPVPPGES